MPESMSATPLVTVVTVTYNSAGYVRNTIESVLAQSYKNIEYIILDDNSTDNTWEIISGYKDPRIKAIRNEQNLKEYPNRNKALTLAQGEYLLYIDGDDVLFTHGVAFFVEQMQVFPEAAFAVQKGYYNNILFPALLEPEEVYRNFFFGRNGLLSSSFASNFFRTRHLKEMGIQTQWITGDDELRLRLASKYPVLFVSGWVSWPRETPGQASSKITRGIALTETYKMVTALFEEESRLEKSLKDAILDYLSCKMAKAAVEQFVRLKWKDALLILKSGAVSLRDIIRFPYFKSTYSDFLEAHSPSNPFQRSLERMYTIHKNTSNTSQ